MKFTKPPAPFLLTQSMDLPKHPKNSQTHSINPHRSLTRALPKIWFWLAFNEPENSGHFLFSSWLPFLSHSRRKSVYLNLLISFRLVFNSWRQSFADQRKSNKRITLISPGICLSRCFVDDIKGKEGERRGKGGDHSSLKSLKRAPKVYFWIYAISWNFKRIQFIN